MEANHLTLVYFVFLFVIFQVSALLRATSLKCAVETEFGEVKLCKITTLNRIKYLITLRIELKRTVQNKFFIHFQLMKKASGGHWHPFLYSMKIDACDFLLHPTRYPIPNLGFYYIRNYTNVNHTCPYKVGESVTIDSFDFDETSILQNNP